MSPLLLAYADRTGLFMLDTDSSDSGLGAVLLQIQNDQEKGDMILQPITLKTRKKYCVTRKESLAVVKAVKHNLIIICMAGISL